MTISGLAVVPWGMPRCAAPTTPACPEPAYCKGLCSGHYRRSLRGVAIDSPLETRGDLEEPIHIRLPKEVVDALEAEAARTKTTRSEIHRAVLERWAKRRGGA